MRESLRRFMADIDRYRMRPRSRVLLVLFTQGLWAATVHRLLNPLVRSRRWLPRQAGRVAGLALGKLVEVTAGIQLPQLLQPFKIRRAALLKYRPKHGKVCAM